jgi:xanthine phosphoribosyltransferase
LKPATAYAVVTWEQLHRDARTLAGALIHQAFTGIVAVTRGGLIPAAIIARELELRLIESISVISYEGEAGTAAPPRIVKPAAAAGDGAGFLVIDDLVDSGETARAVRAALPAAYFACLYAKPAGRPYTDRFVAEVPQDTWILFPWDTAPLFVPPLAQAGKGGGDQAIPRTPAHIQSGGNAAIPPTPAHIQSGGNAAIPPTPAHIQRGGNAAIPPTPPSIS